MSAYVNGKGILFSPHLNIIEGDIIKGQASGGAVVLTDASPIRHNLGVRVSSKNLIPYPYYDTTKEVNGITFTDNGDGSITMNGTATANALFWLETHHNDKNIHISKGAFLSGTQNDAGSGRYGLTIITTEENYWADYGHGLSISAGTTIKGIYVMVFAGYTVNNVTIYPQLEIGTTATPYTPFVPDISAVKLLAQGKNLISSDIWSGVFDKQADGSYLSNRVLTDTGRREFYLPPAVYTVSYDVKCEAGANYRLSIVYEDDTTQDNYVASTGDYVHSERLTNGKAIKAIGWCYSDISQNVQFKNLQIAINPATEYEPYIAPVEYPVNADGSVSGVKSIFPCTTLMTDTEGVLIECEYNKDVAKVISSLEKRIAELEAQLIS